MTQQQQKRRQGRRAERVQAGPDAHSRRRRAPTSISATFSGKTPNRKPKNRNNDYRARHAGQRARWSTKGLAKQRVCCFTVNLRKYTIKQQIVTAFVSVSFFILLSLCIVCIASIIDLGSRTSSAAIESLRNQTETNAETFSNVNAIEISATLQRRASAANIIAYALSDLYFADELTFDLDTP